MTKTIITTTSMILCSMMLWGASHGTASAQNDNPASKATKQQEKEAMKLQQQKEKQEAKLQQQRDKDIKKARQQFLDSITVNLADVALFPQNYLSRKVRARASMGELKSFDDNGATYYFVSVLTSGSRTFMNFPLSNSVTFIISESYARAMVNYYQEHQKTFGEWYPANVTFQIRRHESNGQVYYLADISCVDFVGFMGKVLQSVGDCS
jgi:hypothetical protein